MARPICLCGFPLTKVPGRCQEGCGRVWPSQAALEAEWTARQADQLVTEVIHVAPTVVIDPRNRPTGPTKPLCECGVPAPPVGFCRSCGRPPRAAPVQPVCLLAGGQLIALPEHAEIELGRHSPWAQVAAALAELPGVSRRHATITVDAGQVRVRDLQSLNGTWVDGREIMTPITRGVPLVVRLGISAQIELRRPTPAERFSAWTGAPRV